MHSHLPHTCLPLPAGIAFAAALATACSAAAAPLPPAIRAAAEGFLVQQAQGAPGAVAVRIQDPAGVAPLPPCEAVQPFLPAGVAAWGRVSLGIRCAGERPWTRFLTAQVSVDGRYFVAARSIPAGRTIGPDDVAEAHGDLTKLPRSVGTAAEQVTGMVAVHAMAPGAPVRTDRLRGEVVVQQGQTVRVLAQGPGFAVSAEGRALTAAAAGAAVQVKMADGRTLTGSAQHGGRVVLAN